LIYGGKAKRKQKVWKMTPKLEKLLGKIEKDIKEGRNLSPRFTNMDESIKYLDKL